MIALIKINIIIISVILIDALLCFVYMKASLILIVAFLPADVQMVDIFGL
jgi:hypothetical protein